MALSNKIGVMVDSFNLGIREGLIKAKAVGADGVQIYAVNGEMAPDRLSPSARNELKAYLNSLGLEVSALCGDFGGHGFQDKHMNPEKIEKSKRIIDLALELGSNVVTTHIGIVPDDENGEIYDSMLRACEELGVYARSLNAYFAIETGPERCAHLKSFLDKLSTNGVSVNFDPANLIMVTGDDPAAGVIALKDYIVHTHVKDGVRYGEADPRDLYGFHGYAPDSEKVRLARQTCKEVPLGQGHVRFDDYFAALRTIGYNGYLTVERETGDDPARDIAEAVQFIRKYV
ncbi:sugar phosphate isomerase/epimerase [Paenibacillus rhizovicinus]|uniref:Sugar phosphate isomerase/epimerase n=1 Tax=Paenibacillus rhizovicinus TaxID=2704463 RepID=A0A6C0P4H1_9BACL|nr:sugar phosphate isomerase/epimerase family protein [Paenibacillus rhizovicinus]QHW33450.1 sugar phosphate isomerase/epimerase [Paenibacillus rhizovicinus]